MADFDIGLGLGSAKSFGLSSVSFSTPKGEYKNMSIKIMWNFTFQHIFIKILS